MVREVDSGWKTTNQCLNKLIPSGVWRGNRRNAELHGRDPSVRQEKTFACRPYCIERGRSPEFLYLAVLRGLLVVFSRAAQTIAWIWMSRRGASFVLFSALQLKTEPRLPETLPR